MNYSYIDQPASLEGWIAWLIWLGILAWGLRVWWEPLRKAPGRRWLITLGLAALTPLTTLVLRVRLPIQGLMPLPGLPIEPLAPALMLLFALPYVLAAGFAGPLAAVMVALLAGALAGVADTHNLFTMLEAGSVALLFSAAIRQRYRTRLFKFIRHPFGASILLAIVCAPLYILGTFLSTSGTLAVRMDYALTQTWPLMLTRAIELLTAGLVAEGVYLFRPRHWGKIGPLQPSPIETSIQKRFLFVAIPLVVILLLGLIIGDWVVAGNAARQMIGDRISNTAKIAADSIPYLMETGQSYISSLAQPELATLTGTEIQQRLSDGLRATPYFRQLYFFDQNGGAVTGYPSVNRNDLYLTAEEETGILLALKGVSSQTYISAPRPEEKEMNGVPQDTARISFIALVADEHGKPLGVLFGRTDLEFNPLTRPALQALQSLQELDGEGVIMDENHKILFHTRPELVMTDYIGQTSQTNKLLDEVSPTGTRRLAFYEEAAGKKWIVVASIPAERAQKMALDIALPLLALLVGVMALVILAMRMALSGVSNSMQTLAQEATQIAQGKLDIPLQVKGVDEVGQFSLAFEQMRISLRARLDELNRLLTVSQGVATNLEAGSAIRPVLEAALLGDGATMARAVLVRDVTLDLHTVRPFAVGVGATSDAYSYLDDQLYELMRFQELLTIPNVPRMRRLNVPADVLQPGALVAIKLKYEDRFYGCMWVAFDQPHNFSEEEIRFLSTLAGEAALAAANARLYATAEIGRQRLEATLAASPDPVLVIDEQMRLLVLNPAAIDLPGLINSPILGRHIGEMIEHKDLLDLLISPLEQKLVSREIEMGNSRVYFVSVAPVAVDDQQKKPGGEVVGRVCVMRDITQYKELDQLKSDFVSTVSHDLRSPLTLMRGYATMLTMVGELNEQQKGYVKKIIGGVENMTRLVNNLLDLGRIETGIGLQIEKVALVELTDGVVSSLQPQAAQKNQQLSFESGGVEPGLTLEADKALITQALYNLVENAIKYTPMGGQVRVKMQLRPEMVVLEVHDNGIGVAPLDLPHLFEKFYRSGRREAYQQRGTGLGLAIVKSIAERHGGRVWVESQLGKGSVFFLLVPLKQYSNLNKPQ